MYNLSLVKYKSKRLVLFLVNL